MSHKVTAILTDFVAVGSSLRLTLSTFVCRERREQNEKKQFEYRDGMKRASVFGKISLKSRSSHLAEGTIASNIHARNYVVKQIQ